MRTGVTLADAERAEPDEDPMVWVQENAAPGVNTAPGGNTAPGEDNTAPMDEAGAPGEPHAQPGPPLRHPVTIEEVEDEGENPSEGEDMDDECGVPFIEEFSDARAGQPIDNSRAVPFDLRAHMASVGPFASPKHFEAAELLMTTKMTNDLWDEHLKSRKVSELYGQRVMQLTTYPCTVPGHDTMAARWRLDEGNRHATGRTGVEGSHDEGWGGGRRACRGRLCSGYNPSDSRADRQLAFQAIHAFRAGAPLDIKRPTQEGVWGDVDWGLVVENAGQCLLHGLRTANSRFGGRCC
jgi:hypothetical protein